MEAIARIYKITNNKTKRLYIGFTTKTIQSRLTTHFWNVDRPSGSYNRNSKLYNSIRKYGKDKFTIEELYCSNDKTHTIKVIEPLLIQEFNSYNNGYNCTMGGEGNLNFKPAKSQLDAVIKANSKTYELISINDSKYIITNLKKWARDKDLDSSTLFKLVSKERITPYYGIKTIRKLQYG